MTEVDITAVARGIDLIKRAIRTLDRRKYTDKLGSGWTVPEAWSDITEYPRYVGVRGKAVLYPSDDGRKYSVHTYTYGGKSLCDPKEYKTLDSALRYGERVVNGESK